MKKTFRIDSVIWNSHGFNGFNKIQCQNQHFFGIPCKINIAKNFLFFNN